MEYVEGLNYDLIGISIAVIRYMYPLHVVYLRPNGNPLPNTTQYNHNNEANH